MQLCLIGQSPHTLDRRLRSFCLSGEDEPDSYQSPKAAQGTGNMRPLKWYSSD